MKRRVLLSGLLLATLVWAGPAVSADLAYTTQKDQTYTPAGWPAVLQADVYKPTATGAMPAVLLIHGGGWTGGKRSLMESTARKLARQGYVAVTASYRLAPGWRHPAQLDDVRQALRWMRASHASLQIDPQRVAVWGYSAGAHLAGLLGASDAAPQDRVQAVVAGGMPADLRHYPDNPLIGALMGSKPANDAARWAAASPVTHVGRNSPPFFFYHGTLDTTFELKNPRAMKAALDAAGVESRIYEMNGLSHIPAFQFDSAAVQEALVFLDRQLGGAGSP
ncbi:MAG TPA: alpha/beta hydrolase [Solimonas sp.]|nr:alpha/beta hydrolase [Solimonas sp.]